MRVDEKGNTCPETLGEYRDMVFSIVRDVANPAVRFLDKKIDEQGHDEVVLAPDSQMCLMLFEIMRGNGPLDL